MAKKKGGKGKKAPKILTPKRCTINIVYCWRGLSMGTLGMGGPCRRIRTLLLLMEFRRAEISIVGNGTAALPSSEPLTVKLVETGEDLGFRLEPFSCFQAQRAGGGYCCYRREDGQAGSQIFEYSDRGPFQIPRERRGQSDLLCTQEEEGQGEEEEAAAARVCCVCVRSKILVGRA